MCKLLQLWPEITVISEISPSMDFLNPYIWPFTTIYNLVGGFNPSEKILVSWGYYSQYMENKCSKPPTSNCSNCSNYLPALALPRHVSGVSRQALAPSELRVVGVEAFKSFRPRAAMGWVGWETLKPVEASNPWYPQAFIHFKPF
jgi:hypothetical protein